MKRLFIDGVEVDIHHVSAGYLCYKVYVKRKGAAGGPHACHSVPEIEGTFRTNGHRYEFRSGESLGGIPGLLKPEEDVDS